MSFATAGMVGKPLPAGLAPGPGPVATPFSNTSTVDYRAGHAAPPGPHPYARAPLTSEPWSARNAASYAHVSPESISHGIRAREHWQHEREMPIERPIRTTATRFPRGPAGQSPVSNEDMDKLAQKLSHEYMTSIGTKTTPAATSTPVRAAPPADVLVQVSRPAAREVSSTAAADNRELRKQLDELRSNLRVTMDHLLAERRNGAVVAEEMAHHQQNTDTALQAVVDKLVQSKSSTDKAIADVHKEQAATTTAVKAVLDELHDLKIASSHDKAAHNATMSLIGEMVGKMEKQKGEMQSHSTELQKLRSQRVTAAAGTNLDSAALSRLLQKSNVA